MLIHAISEDLHKLLQNRRLTPVALLRKLGRIMIVAVDIPFVLVIRVLSAEDGGTDAAGEVLDVVFAVEGGDVGAAESAAAGVAEEVEAAEIVRFAEGVLVRGLVGDGEEFRSDDFVAVLLQTRG